MSEQIAILKAVKDDAAAVSVLVGELLHEIMQYSYLNLALKVAYN